MAEAISLSGPAAYCLPKRVRDVTSVLDAVGVKSACILGYSLGGITAIGVSTYAPQRLRSAIVLGAHPYTERLPVDFEESWAAIHRLRREGRHREKRG